MDWTDLIPYLALIFVVYVRSRRERELMETNTRLTAALAQLKNPTLAPYIGAAVEVPRETSGQAAGEEEEGFEDHRLGD